MPSIFTRLSNGYSAVKDWLTSPKPMTGGYGAGPRDHFYQTPRDLPPFTFTVIRAMLIDPTLKLGLAMRAAPLAAAEFAYKQPGAGPNDWTDGIEADNPAVGQFVHDQLKRLWTNDLDKLLSAQIWGWAACEVMYRLGKGNRIEFDCLLSRHARDSIAMEQEGQLWGVRFKGIKSQAAQGYQAYQPQNTHTRGQGMVDVPLPKSIWHVHAPECESWYGNSILHGAFSPWADKWLNGGALDVRRLFMTKSAYSGERMRCPNTTMQIDGKGEVPCRDIAREILEQAKAGGVTVFPTMYDAEGRLLWDVTDVKLPGNPEHIRNYPKDLDVEMLRGLEIADEVLITLTGGGGAWQGKQVGQQAFYTGLNRWGNRLVRDVTPIMENLVLLNFGPDAGTFAIRLKPIDATMSAQEEPQAGQGQPGGGSPEGGQQQWHREPGSSPNRMSLDPEAAVGEGVLSAAELVKAAKKVLRRRLALRPGQTKRENGHEYVLNESHRWERVEDASAGKTRPVQSSATKPTGKRKPAPVPHLSEKAQRAKDNHKLVDKDIQRYAEEHNEPRFAQAIGGVSFPDSEAVDVSIPANEKMKRQWFAEAGRYRQELDAWKAGGKKGPRPAPMTIGGPAKHGLELKTMVSNKASKITMKRDAMERKAEWEKKNRAEVHTVVIDDSAVFNAKGPGKHDESKRKIFYRRGYGSFRVNTMHPVKNVAELQKLLDMPNAKLPPAAQRPKAA